MTTSRPDWEEELIHDPEEEYKALLRALRRTQGFGLLFVECSPAEGNRLIQKVREDLPQKTMEVLTFEEPLKDGNVYRRVKQKLAENPVEVLFIQGLEHSLYDYEDTKRHLGWSSEEIYSYSWKGVPPVMVNLNQQRENFRDHFNTCFVFLIPVFVTKYMIHRAPDFFDWRSGIFHFLDNPEETIERLQQLSQEEEYDIYLSLTPSQRIQRIAEIRELLEVSNVAAEQKSALLREQGKLFHANGDLVQALACYGQAIEIKPDYHQAWNNRGNTLSKLGRKEEVIASYDKALEIKPDYHQAWYNRGNALSKLGRKEEAIDSFDKVLEIKPDDHLAWNNRGNALYALGRNEAAIDSYDKALEIKPDLHAAWNNRGSVLYALGRNEAAIDSYDKALEIKPDLHAAWNNRGVALSALGRKEAAIASYDKALDIKPDDHWAWYGRGYALDALGRKEAAIASYDKALEIKPDDPWTWFNRGNALFALGRKEAAIASHEKALRIRRENGNKRNELASLQILASLYQKTGRVRDAWIAIIQYSQIFQELDLPIDQMPYPRWVKSILKFADQGKLQVILLGVGFIIAAPFVFVYVLLMFAFNAINALIRKRL